MFSPIKNLVKEPDEKKPPARKTKKPNEKSDDDGSENEEKKEAGKPRPIIKTAVDLQRLKLDKLMKNPEKPVILPEPRREKDYLQAVPTFVRNVMGSSAGAGSGEFHVYRHLRRKEYARQKTIQAKSIKEQMDEDFQKKMEENRRLADEKTAKKRAKRLKKKQRYKKRARQQGTADADVGGATKNDAAKDDEQTSSEASNSDESDDGDAYAYLDTNDVAEQPKLDKKDGTAVAKSDTKDDVEMKLDANDDAAVVILDAKEVDEFVEDEKNQRKLEINSKKIETQETNVVKNDKLTDNVDEAEEEVEKQITVKIDTKQKDEISAKENVTDKRNTKANEEVCEIPRNVATAYVDSEIKSEIFSKDKVDENSVALQETNTSGCQEEQQQPIEKSMSVEAIIRKSLLTTTMTMQKLGQQFKNRSHLFEDKQKD